jgi:hypothetical protein
VRGRDRHLAEPKACAYDATRVRRALARVSRTALRSGSEKLPKSMSKSLSAVRRKGERASPTNPKD